PAYMKQVFDLAREAGGRAGVQEVMKLKEQKVEINTSLDLLTKTKFGRFMTDEQKLIFDIPTTATAQKVQEKAVKGTDDETFSDLKVKAIKDKQKGDSSLFDLMKDFERNPSSAENFLFFDEMKRAEAGGKSRDDAIVQAKEVTEAFIRGKSSERAGGAVEGRLGVRGTPEFKEVEADIARVRAEGSLKGKPLGETVLLKGTAIKQGIRVASQLRSEFTREERASFVGFLKLPFNKIAQLERKDPNFARFLTLINRAKGAAFGEGGKQLTPFEADVVFGYVPTGEELVAVNFEAKLDSVLSEGPQLYNDLIGLSKTPRGKLKPLVVPSAGGGSSKGNVSDKEKAVREKFGLE
ncbi:hypothetical protein LCGC14_2664810, partial [marine sediment metagenome]